jgi:hypothetical protein
MPEAHQEPSLTLTSQQTTFRKGEPFKVKLEVYSPEDSLVNISLGASKNLGLAQEQLQITVAAGQTQSLELSGTPKRSGYYNITANATGRGWHEPAADMLGFNVASTDVTAASASAYLQSTSGLESLETHLDNLPKFSTPEAYSQLDTAQTIDDVKDTDHVRLDSRLENVQFDKQDGTKTASFNTVLGFLPDSGSGQPTPDQLKPPSAKQRAMARPQGAGCGLGNWATVSVRISYNGKTFMLPRTKITVFDDNPWWSTSVIASGYTDNYGNYTFQKPACDWGAWWDYSQPDIFFVVETLDSSEIGVWNIFAALGWNNTYGIRTGTNWDVHPDTHSFDVSLNGGNSDSENAMWFYRMVQLAQDFNVGAGGNGASYFPIRIAWPSRIPFSDWWGGTSFAPVAKLEIRGEHWLSPYNSMA